MKTQTNYELREIIENSSDAKEKQAAWEQLLKQNPDNEDLRYIIRYTDLKQAAWEQLLKQNPDNDNDTVIKLLSEKVNQTPNN